MIIPNSSSNSGSALIAPLVKRLKESVKSLPKAIDAFLATEASPSSWLPLRPAAVPIETACAASSKASRPPVAACIFEVSKSKDLPVVLA